MHDKNCSNLAGAMSSTACIGLFGTCKSASSMVQPSGILVSNVCIRPERRSTTAEATVSMALFSGDAEAADGMRSPPKQPPEGEGGSKQLAIMEAVDDTEGLRDRDPQTLAERIQI